MYQEYLLMSSSPIQKPTALTALYELCQSDASTHTEITAAAREALEQASPWAVLSCAVAQLSTAEEGNQAARRFVKREIEALEPSYHYRATGDHWTVFRYEASTGAEDWTANVDTEAWALRMVAMGNELLYPYGRDLGELQVGAEREDLKSIELERLFLITGRVSEDEDETVHIVEAPDAGTAERLFIDQVRQECFDDGEEKTVYVIDSTSLANAIDQRVREEGHPVEE